MRATGGPRQSVPEVWITVMRNEGRAKAKSDKGMDYVMRDKVGPRQSVTKVGNTVGVTKVWAKAPVRFLTKFEIRVFT